MAATVENLREILFNVEPPKQLIDRKTEIVLTSKSALDILKNPSRDTAKKFCQILFDEMVCMMSFTLAQNKDRFSNSFLCLVCLHPICKVHE